jgi:hypothetical protein
MPTNVLKHQDVELVSSKELLNNAINANQDQNQLVDVPNHSTETPGHVNHAHSAGDKITTLNNVLRFTAMVLTNSLVMPQTVTNVSLDQRSNVDVPKDSTEIQTPGDAKHAHSDGLILETLTKASTTTTSISMPTNVLKHQDVELDSSKELLNNAINANQDQNQLVDVPNHSTETPGNVRHAHSALDKTMSPNNVLKHHNAFKLV